MVPTYVTRDDLQAALAPFFDLLGTDAMRIYSVPGIHIGADSITFCAVPEPVEHETWPSGVKVNGTVNLADIQIRHPQDDEFAELACVVNVEIIDGKIIEDES